MDKLQPTVLYKMVQLWLEFFLWKDLFTNEKKDQFFLISKADADAYALFQYK